MQRRRDLYLCTIYPEKLTNQMVYNIKELQQGSRLTLKPILVQAGHFSHRHKPDRPDPVQIKVRQTYIDAVPDAQWLLILDSDEVILTHPDCIADYIDYLEANNKEVGMLTEVRVDGQLLGRPRLLKKRIGMEYGGPYQKHDVIWYCDHEGGHDITREATWICEKGRNYIDVHDTEHSMDIPIRFFHVKRGLGMEFIVPLSKGEVLKHPEWVIEAEVDL